MSMEVEYRRRREHLGQHQTPSHGPRHRTTLVYGGPTTHRLNLTKDQGWSNKRGERKALTSFHAQPSKPPAVAFFNMAAS